MTRENVSRFTSGRTEVRYRNRRTDEIIVEQVPAENALRRLYETAAGRFFGGLVFGNGALSHLYGWWQNRSRTQRKIRPFVDRFRIDLDEVEFPLDQYSNFNAFFSRRLQPGARSFPDDPQILCSPGDGKALVFPHLTEEIQFPVKGSSITPASLLACEEAARPYLGGSALIVRLAPPDYHRFHFPDDGRASTTHLVRGGCHSVNPIALACKPEIFHLNRRAVTQVGSANFGPLACVEIGAFAVASIVQTFVPGPVRRGQEKGFFQFGGSTLVLLFTPGAVRFDDDLVRDSAAGLEVQVTAGSSVGRAP